jgi:predicted RNase H-like HicB family nuclease
MKQQRFIKLKIEKFNEQGQDYFVATSEDIQGLVAEGSTIAEVLEIAADIARLLLEIERETKEESFRRLSIPNEFEYPLILEV